MEKDTTVVLKANSRTYDRSGLIGALMATYAELFNHDIPSKLSIDNEAEMCIKLSRLHTILTDAGFKTFNVSDADILIKKRSGEDYKTVHRQYHGYYVKNDVMIYFGTRLVADEYYDRATIDYLARPLENPDPEGLMDEKQSLVSAVNSFLIFYTNPESLEEFKTQALGKIPFYKLLKSTPNIRVVTKDTSGFRLRRMPVNTTNVEIDKHYNDDFLDIDTLIKQKLVDTEKGIIILQGEMGTGKTNYIRHLTSEFATKKTIILIPPNLANDLASPSFIDFLISDCKNSVLIIEDGENIIKSRSLTGGGSQAVSNLLNISDGLLSDILKIQIIVTCNCPISEIDEALLRKGRLIAKYEFGKLSVEKTNKLFESLSMDVVSKEMMSLTQIFNYEDKSFLKKAKEKIGF